MRLEIESDCSRYSGRWNDFALPPRGDFITIDGVHREQKGIVEFWDNLNCTMAR